MQRRYVSGGREREVEQVDEVVAVLPEEALEGPEALATLGDSQARAEGFGRPAGAEELELSEDESTAFGEAGWTFVVAEPEVARAADSGESVGGAADIRHVYRAEGKRTLIGTDRMTVRLSEDFDEAAVEQALAARGFEVLRELRFAPNLFEVRVAAGTDPLELSIELEDDEAFVYAEPEFVEHIPPRWIPTDPEHGQQWHLRNTGQNGGTAGADIRAHQAWDATRGEPFVRLAVIDNGCQVDHPDLQAGIGGAAYFRTTPTGAQLTQGTAGFPVNNHGTFCAGMAAARTDNGRGGCGVAPGVALMPIACLTDQVGTQATLARAVAFAADPSTEVTGADPASGATVISCSLGPNGANWAMTAVLRDAIDFAVTRGRAGRGTPVFWAVTNGNFEIRFDEVCAYTSTIAVSRSTRRDVHDNAGFGPELDFVATGVDVYSTRMGSAYGTATGTSYAAPTAAGVAALMVTANPGLRWRQVRTLMRRTCDRVGGVAYDANGRHDRYGFGRVNAARAVTAARPCGGALRITAGDLTGNRRTELVVTSPWGIGVWQHAGSTFNVPMMAPNGTRFGGWLLNTADNHVLLTSDLDGDGRDESMISSPWGIGVLKLAGSTFNVPMMAPNGTRFGGWLLNTADNRFGPAGDFDGDGRTEVLVTSPWGIGILKLGNGTFNPLVMAPNGTRFGGWLLNTADNRFCLAADLNGDGRDELLVVSPWGVGVLRWDGTALRAPMMAPNSTRFGGWLLNTTDNQIGPAADLDADNRAELLIRSPWGIGVLKLSGTTFTVPMMAPNGTRFGGWLLNTADNNFDVVRDLDGDRRADVVVTSPWGIGVLQLSGSTFTVPMMAPNGTRFGDWLLNTADNRIGVGSEMR
jgi:subtilisin family serine protease